MVLQDVLEVLTENMGVDDPLALARGDVLILELTLDVTLEEGEPLLLLEGRVVGEDEPEGIAVTVVELVVEGVALKGAVGVTDGDDETLTVLLFDTAALVVTVTVPEAEG